MRVKEALFEANKIAFSPFVFETAYTMLELGMFEIIISSTQGKTILEISEESGISKYGVTVLVEMAECSGMVEKEGEEHYKLTKIGYFLLRDEMTKVNLRFTHDVCYKGLYDLKDAIVNGKPEGLKVFGDWPTVYEGLSKLPEQVKKSWFEFDHLYSDNAFDEALKIIFATDPNMIFDIGGNTGKWAIASTNHDPNVNVTIFDLPGQIKVAQENIGSREAIRDRVNYQTINLLDPTSEIPGGADVYWMSQFLDCFGEDEIEQILLKIKKNMSKDARIYIMETFIDNQRFPAATFSLVATSLYFTTIANGNSKMYSSSVMKYIVQKAGLTCINEHHLHKDSFHTILEIGLK